MNEPVPLQLGEFGRRQEMTRDRGLFDKEGLEVDDESLRNTFQNISLFDKASAPEHLPMVSLQTFIGRNFETC